MTLSEWNGYFYELLRLDATLAHELNSKMIEMTAKRGEMSQDTLKKYFGDFDATQIKSIIKEKENVSENIVFSSGTTSTKQPRLDMIPPEGLKCAADRFEYGYNKHRDTCYQVKGQACLEDKEWLVSRLSHVIQHAYDAIKLIKQGDIASKPMYDNAGAIAFGGLVLGEAVVHWRKINTNQDDPSKSQE